MTELNATQLTILKILKEKNNAHLSFIFEYARRNRPLLLDGAIGSQLINKRMRAHPQLWSSIFNLTHPEKVLTLHKKYISAGADIITTNTFRTNPTAIKQSKMKLRAKEFVKRSVELAVESVADKYILIAGSNAPAEDCYQVERKISHKEIERNHAEHISYLCESGVDLILNETQSHFDEIKFIDKHCAKQSIPYILNIFFTEKLRLLSGEKLSEVITLLNDSNAIAVGFNCITFNVFEKLKKSLPLKKNWGFYLNCVSGAYDQELISCSVSPNEYSKKVEEYFSFCPSFIGACCGSSSKHISELKNRFYGTN